MNTEASTALAEIMNMIIICSLAAWWIEDPPRMVPVIIPGMEMIPMTLNVRINEIRTREKRRLFYLTRELTSCC